MFYLATVFFSVPFGLVGSHDIAFPPHCFYLVIHYTEQRKCPFSSQEVSQPFSLAFTLGGGSWALALGSGSWRSGQISALMFSFGIPFPNHLPPQPPTPWLQSTVGTCLQPQIHIVTVIGGNARSQRRRLYETHKHIMVGTWVTQSLSTCGGKPFKIRLLLLRTQIGPYKNEVQFLNLRYQQEADLELTQSRGYLYLLING